MTATTTITTTIPAPAPMMLRLQRAPQLLDLLRASPLFTDEERAALADAEAYQAAHPARALTYILLHVVREAIIRNGDAIEEQLFAWDDELLTLIQERLPAGETAEAFVEAFEAMEEEAQGLDEQVAAVQRVFQKVREETRAAANRVNHDLREGAAQTRAGVLAVHQDRLVELEQIRIRMEALSAGEEAAAEQLGANGAGSADAAGRMEAANNRFLDRLRRGIS